MASMAMSVITKGYMYHSIPMVSPVYSLVAVHWPKAIPKYIPSGKRLGIANIIQLYPHSRISSPLMGI